MTSDRDVPHVFVTSLRDFTELSVTMGHWGLQSSRALPCVGTVSDCDEAEPEQSETRVQLSEAR